MNAHYHTTKPFKFKNAFDIQEKIIYIGKLKPDSQ